MKKLKIDTGIIGIFFSNKTNRYTPKIIFVEIIQLIDKEPKRKYHQLNSQDESSIINHHWATDKVYLSPGNYYYRYLVITEEKSKLEDKCLAIYYCGTDNYS